MGHTKSIEKMIYHPGWKYFNCQHCGQCCELIGLPYDGFNIHKMAEYLNISVHEVIEKYYGAITDDGKHWESQDHKRTPCPFLVKKNNKKLCSIYKVRPGGCIYYPLETDFGPGTVDCPAYKIAHEKLREEESKG